jgi:hypothetical protein
LTDRDGGMPGSLSSDEYDEVMLLSARLNRTGKAATLRRIQRAASNPHDLLTRLRVAAGAAGTGR